MHLRGLSLVPFIVCCMQSLLQAQGTCFSGPIRQACRGFLILETTGVASAGFDEHTESFTLPPGAGLPSTREVRYHDLPSYVSGAVGYVGVVDSNTAIGGVAEFGFSNARRIALTARWRRQLPGWTLDVAAGPITTGIREPTTFSCCSQRATAYGGTLETAVMLRGYGGVTLGGDVVRGLGRTSTAAHAGVRIGSYGTVVAATISALAVVGLVILLGGGPGD